MSLGDATVFPLEPDGNSPLRLAWGYRTNVMTAENGAEVRAALRTVPVRRLEFTAVFANQVEAAQFRSLWLAAAERLRFIVPVWPFLTTPTAIAGSTITTDTRNRDFVEGGRAIVWRSVTDWEIVEIDALTDGSITTVDPIAGAYPVPQAVSVVPLMTAWIAPPTLDELSVEVERVPLAFDEELEAIAGIAAGVGESVTPVATTLALETVSVGSPWAGRKFTHLRAIARDAAGQRILFAPIEWTVTPTADAGAPTRVVFPEDGQEVAAEYVNGTNSGYLVHAECGTATVDGAL